MRQKQTRHAQGKGASLASGQRGPLLYRLEDTPAIGKRLLYSLQFVVIFMGSVVLVPMLVAEPLGWSQEHQEYCTGWPCRHRKNHIIGSPFVSGWLRGTHGQRCGGHYSF